MKTIILLLASLCAYGQTAINLNQIKASTTTSTASAATTAMVPLSINGRTVWASIDLSGLAVDTTTNPPTLKLASPLTISGTGTNGFDLVPGPAPTTPPKNGAVFLFFNSANGNHLSAQDANLNVTDLQAPVPPPPPVTLPIFVDGEPLSGTVDGINGNFFLANAPLPASSLHVYRNGLLLSAGTDYTAVGQAVVFKAIPQAGDTLTADYRH